MTTPVASGWGSGVWSGTQTWGGSPSVLPPWINIAGTWRPSTIWLNVGGVWKTVVPYVNVSGTWRS